MVMENNSIENVYLEKLQLSMRNHICRSTLHNSIDSNVFIDQCTGDFVCKLTYEVLSQSEKFPDRIIEYEFPASLKDHAIKVLRLKFPILMSLPLLRNIKYKNTVHSKTIKYIKHHSYPDIKILKGDKHGRHIVQAEAEVSEFWDTHIRIPDFQCSVYEYQTIDPSKMKHKL